MPLSATIAEVPEDARLAGIAARLLDVASRVASESEAATAVVRGVSHQASRIAQLAAALEDAAAAVEEDVRRQARTLEQARAVLRANRPTIDALAESVGGVATISATIALIARESRMLSLNAQIEAARSGASGGAFGAISAEMAALTARTTDANAAVGKRSASLADDVQAARQVAVAHAALVEEQDGLLAASLDSAGRQRLIASELAEITAETAGTVDDAASAIGRIGANAVAVKLLARQMSKAAAG